MKKNADFVLAQPDRDQEDDRISVDPLSFLPLLRRLFMYTGRHASTRNWLIALVTIRSVQLPLLAWGIGAVINGPIERRDLRGTLWGAFWFALFAAFTQFCFYFRHDLHWN